MEGIIALIVVAVIINSLIRSAKNKAGKQDASRRGADYPMGRGGFEELTDMLDEAVEKLDRTPVETRTTAARNVLNRSVSKGVSGDLRVGMSMPPAPIGGESMRYVSSEGYGTQGLPSKEGHVSSQGKSSGEGECEHPEYTHVNSPSMPMQPGMNVRVASRHSNALSESADAKYGGQNDYALKPQTNIKNYVKQEKAYDHEAVAAASQIVSQLKSAGLKNMVVASEILKRPKLGVPPRLR